MRLHQGFHRPVFGQDATVADDDGLVLDADLYGRAKHIAIVGDRVVNRLAYGIARKRIGLNPPVVFVGDFRLQIFQVNQVNHLVGNLDERILQNILIQQVGVAAETAYLHITAHLNATRVAVEKQHC